MRHSVAIVVAFGGIACVALSMLMQRALKVYEHKVAGPVAASVSRSFGSRLERPAVFRVRESDDGRRLGSLVLQALPGIGIRTLVRDAGAMAWRDARDRIDALEVTCASAEHGVARFAVPPPWQLTGQLVELEPAATPPPVPTPATPATAGR